MEGKTSVLKIVLCTVAVVLIVEAFIVGTLGVKYQQSTLKNVYNAGLMGYKIGYPEKWNMNYQNNQTVTFSVIDVASKKNSEVILQNILTKEAGGLYSDVGSITDAYKNQYLSSDGVFANESVITRTTKSGSALIGQQFEAKFTKDNKPYRLWQVVIPSTNNKFFYSWSYLAPDEIYQKNMPFARAMLGSWTIN